MTTKRVKEKIEALLSEGIASVPMQDSFSVSYTAVQNKIGEIVWSKAFAELLPDPVPTNGLLYDFEEQFSGPSKSTKSGLEIHADTNVVLDWLRARLPTFKRPDPVPEFSGFEKIPDAPKSALTFDPVAEGECCKDCRNGNCPTRENGKRVCPCHTPKEEKCQCASCKAGHINGHNQLRHIRHAAPPMEEIAQVYIPIEAQEILRDTSNTLAAVVDEMNRQGNLLARAVNKLMKR